MARLQGRLRWFVLAATVLGLMVGAARRARADTMLTLYNTGVGADGTLLPDGTIGDPHYTLISTPDGSTTQLLIRTEAGGYPVVPYYVGDDNLSAWIGPNNNDPEGVPGQLYGPRGIYIYTTYFDLSGLDPSTASIRGLWSTDNVGLDILINGVSTGVGSGYSDYWATLQISSGFIQGINTLEFIVYNDSGPTALRVEMTGTADPLTAVPEPSTVAMIATGLPLGLGFWWRLRRRAGAGSMV